MIRWIIMFLIISAIAAFFGFVITSGFSDVAKAICYAFLGLCFIFLFIDKR